MNSTKSKSSQDKRLEISFFNKFADSGDYSPFHDQTNEDLVDRCIAESGMKPGMIIADLGCGSGVFTRVLRKKGLQSFGVDISLDLLRSSYAHDRAAAKVPFVRADIEHLPIKSGSLDAVFLAGVIHHFPDPRRCAAEVNRILKPGGIFAAFDPNRRNPFMWAYRDHDSPFYSPIGVTPNERPIIASEVREIFGNAGFDVSSAFMSGIRFKYVESPVGRLALPIYNFIDTLLFTNRWMAPYSSFVITCGVKPGILEQGPSVDLSEQSSLVDLLACPVTESPLKLNVDEGKLYTADSNSSYEIVDGVADLLAEQKKISA